VVVRIFEPEQSPSDRSTTILHDVILHLDGPMGTELAARGVSTEGEGWSAYAIDVAPEIVRAIHADYAKAGATIHRTNTFRTQPRIFPETWRSLTKRAVDLARTAPGRVAGSIASVFDCYRPDLSPAPDVARAAHRSLSRALSEDGVDLLICETFPHTGEARIAVEEAVLTGKETWVALTAGPDGSLMTPEAMEAAARDCVSAGASAVLVCCTAATLTLPYVDRLVRVGVPTGAYANIGLGEDERTMTPTRYFDLAMKWKESGATILGSCCGTNPAYVEMLYRG
jgi:S-methylmethionine-dependent homocysteine/selenocysteine methylase